MGKAVKYNESVTGMSVEDPFILGSGSVLPGNYKDVLNVEEKEGVMGYIEIPAIDVMLPIYHGVSERVLRRGVGHMETTALPIGGKVRIRFLHPTEDCLLQNCLQIWIE